MATGIGRAFRVVPVALHLAAIVEFCAVSHLTVLRREWGVTQMVASPGLIWQRKSMDRHTVLSKLREHEDELKAAGIVRLSLFGSVARGDANDQSDVDLMAEFDSSRKLSLFDMVGLEERLAEIVGVAVDLSPAKMLKQPVMERAAREAVLAF